MMESLSAGSPAVGVPPRPGRLLEPRRGRTPESVPKSGTFPIFCPHRENPPSEMEGLEPGSQHINEYTIDNGPSLRLIFSLAFLFWVSELAPLFLVTK